MMLFDDAGKTLKDHLETLWKRAIRQANNATGNILGAGTNGVDKAKTGLSRTRVYTENQCHGNRPKYCILSQYPNRLKKQEPTAPSSLYPLKKAAVASRLFCVHTTTTFIWFPHHLPIQWELLLRVFHQQALPLPQPLLLGLPLPMLPQR